MDRIPIDHYLMLIAWAASMRSTCPRMACGAVVSQNGIVVATGYNGAPSGMPHCSEVGCKMRMVRERERCTRIIHAEMNALRHAQGRGNWLHSTGELCYNCLMEVKSHTNIERIVYWKPYPDDERDVLLDELGPRFPFERLKDFNPENYILSEVSSAHPLR